MEIIFVLTGILILAAFVFLLIEYPYYLVSVFIFLHLYEYNFELPVPLDLRGLISVALFIRLVVFEKKNLELLRESVSNRFFILIILLSLYTAVNFFLHGTGFLTTIRSLILNFVSLLLGFLTIANGYGKKTIVLTLLIIGIIATGDLIYTYIVKGTLLIRKIIDVIIGINAKYNHNFFGSICAQALIITIILYINKQIKKTSFFTLIIIFSFGILMSTSRMVFLTATITLILILLTNSELNFRFKKIFIYGFGGVIIFTIIAISYIYILSAMEIKSKLADDIYWRLVEEPMSFFAEDNQNFTSRGQEVEGSMSWRIGKALRDVNVFFQQENNVILFGFGERGYFKIGETQFIKGGNLFQYAPHNFYTNLVTEIGILGLLLFLFFILSLLFHGIKLIKTGRLHFSLLYLILYLFIYSTGANSYLLDEFAYMLYGCVIAEFLQVVYVEEHQTKSFNNP